MAVYLTGIYMDEQARHEFETEYHAIGVKYDVGKSYVSFKKLNNLPFI
jgi:hypothetical protein